MVTGAAGALGLAVARRLGAEPGVALLLADVNETGLRRSVTELSDLPVEVRTQVTDVGDGAAVDELVDVAVAWTGRLDVMINNAGVLSPNARLHNLTEADWDAAVRVNLMGTVHGIGSAVRVMRGLGDGGSIVSTASVAGLTAWPYASAYGATKAAVIQLTKVAALEYAQDRIRVNCVCPGSFESAMQASLPEEALETVAARHPLGLGAPDDLVGAYAYLAGDESRWTTGTAMVVDGGYALP